MSGFMRETYLLGALILICTGCPEPPMRGRIVSLSFPEAQSQTTLVLSPDDGEVQQALKIIGDTLVTDGFVQEAKPVEAAAPGFVASYSKLDTEGRVHRRPLVWLQDNRLLVAFAEGRVPGRIGEETRETVHLLERELINRYGRKRVKVERPHE